MNQIFTLKKKMVEVIEEKSRQLNSELLKAKGLNSKVDLAIVYATDYLELVKSESSETQRNFCDTMMEQANIAKEVFLRRLAQTDENSNLYKHLKNCIWHAESIVLATEYLIESIEMSSEQVKNFLFSKRLAQMTEVFKSGESEIFPGTNKNLEAYDSLEKGDLDHAIKCVNEAIELFPDRSIYHDTLALCYYLKNDLEEAKKSIDRCIELDLEDDDLNCEHLSNRIRINKALGNFSDVEKDQLLINQSDDSYTDPDELLEILKKFNRLE